MIERLIGWALARLGLKAMTDAEYDALLVAIDEDGRRLLGQET